MEFPNLLELSEDEIQLVLKGYMAGMEDQKSSILDFLDEVVANTEDLIVKSALADLVAVLNEETTLGDLTNGK